MGERREGVEMRRHRERGKGGASLILQQVNLCTGSSSHILDDQLTGFAATQLFIGVQQLNTINRPIWSEINVKRFAYVDCLNLGSFLLQASISDVVCWVIG
jgi:hypothetical protein